MLQYIIHVYNYVQISYSLICRVEVAASASRKLHTALLLWTDQIIKIDNRRRAVIPKMQQVLHSP